MTKERLTEFRRKANIEDVDEDDGDSPNNNLLGAANGKSTAMGGAVMIEMQRLDGALEEFFSQVVALKKMIDELKSDVDRIEAQHSRILTIALHDERKNSEVGDLMGVIRTNSQIIRTKLKEMEKTNSKFEEGDKESAQARIRTTQHSALWRNFIDVMHRYQLVQTNYKEKCKDRIKRQFEITGSIFSDDDVDKMIEEGNFSVFTQGILAQTAQAKEMLADVEARHKDILKLEKSLIELHDMFLEMAVLVESQGEMVDTIENHVTATADYVDTGRDELGKAKEKQGQARKTKIWIVIVLTVLALILLIACFI